MKFAVLGPTEVWDGDRPVEPGPSRRRLVLAALLVDVGRVVPLETLLDRVWDGRPGDAATATLQTYISRLRATLASATHSTPATVTTSPRGYALDVADDDVDARRFEALLARARGRRDDGDPAGARSLVGGALALWRGAAYADFEAGFLAVEAARLHDLRLSAYELAADLDLALGRPADVVHAVGPLVAAEPMREPLRAALMLALYRSGRQADALRVYAEGRALLADLLGADPDPGTQLLHERILRQDPTLDAAPPPAATADADPGVGPLPAGGHDRLVGRDAELVTLGAALGRAALGSTEFVAVVGEAGIGKSRLIEELGARARATGHLVAWGRCWQHEGAPALWPWVQVLRELAGRLPDDVLAAATAGRAALVTTVVPELLRGAPVGAGVMASSVEEIEVRIFDAVVAFLEAVSRDRPIVVVVDDLQWADPPSRRLTEYAATQLRESRVAVIVTVRSPGHDESHPDLEVLAALARLTRVHRIDLPPLSAADVRALVGDRVGDDVDEPTATALHTRTGGNPFYVGEIVRLVLTTGVETAMAEGVPDSVRGVIRRRVQRLSETDQAVLRAAAVVGRTFDIDLIAAVTGYEADDVDEAADRATAIGVLRSEPGTADQHRFTHALLQETLLDEIGPARRKRLHRRVAETLAARRAARGPAAAPAEVIAHHRAEAGTEDDLEKAAEFYLLANDDALERRSYAECSGLLQLAIETAARVSGSRGVSLRDAATYRLRAFHMLFDGSHSPYGNWAQGTMQIDPDAPSRDLVTRLHAWWGDLHGRNDLDAADAVSRTMAELAEARDDDLLRLAALMTTAYTLQQRGRFPEARDAFAAMEALLDTVTVPELVFTPDPRVGAPLWRGVCELIMGNPERDEELFALADKRAHDLGDPVAQSYVDGVAIFRQVWRGDGAAAREAAVVIDQNITARNMQMMQVFMGIPLAWTEATVDLARGLALAADAMATLAEPTTLVWRPYFLGMYAEILLWGGRYDDALARIEQGLAEASASGAHGYDAEMHRIRAQVWRATGAPDADVAAEIARGTAVARRQGADLFLSRLGTV